MINEKNIKKWIVIMPLFGVILTSITLTNLFISEVQSQYEIEKKQLILDEEENIRKRLKSRVENIINLLDKNYAQKNTLQNREIKNTVDIAYKIIQTTYNQNIRYGEDVVLAKINEQLRPLRFYDNFSGYYFMFNMDGKTLLAPHIPSLEGSNFFKIKNPHANSLLKDAVTLLNEKSEGPLSWKWYKPNEDVAKRKTGYIKLFKPLNIFVGSAKYDEDIDILQEKKAREFLNIMTFKNKGYVFTYDKSGNTISHINKEHLNQNRWDFKSEGRFTVREIVLSAYNSVDDGAYLRYTASIDPLTNQPADKISYVKAYLKTDWVIGTGIYTTHLLKDINRKQVRMKEKLDETIYKVVIFSLIITFLGIIIMLVLSNRLGQIFNKYKNNLKKVNESLELKVKYRTKELEESKNKLKELTLRDHLTGLYNRRYFDDMIDELMSLSVRKADPLSLIMLDIDKFKNINDTYGHDIGDDVIKTLADTLTSILRESDIITRVGGEEFAIVFPSTSISGASKTSEKIRKNIQELLIKIDEDKTIKFTISIGVAIYDNEIDESIDSTLKRADEALYEAKNTGRNKVIVYDHTKEEKFI